MPLAMLSNLHYFGLMFGALVTVSLLYDLVRDGRMRDLLILGLVSVLSASPALILVAVQLGNQPEHSWIDTSPGQSAEILVQFLRAITLNNLAVFAFAFTAIFRVLASRKERSEQRTTLILGITVIAYFGALFLLNFVQPVVVPRYLTPAIGPIIVGSTLLALGKNATKWTSVAISLCGLLAVGVSIVTDKHSRDGWNVSAAKVANMVAACPETRVFVGTHSGGDERSVPPINGRATGYLYWKTRAKLPITDAPPGFVIPPGDICPNIFWIEHTFLEQAQQLEVDALLKSYGVKAGGRTSLEYVSSGAIITVGPPAPQ
jgi:hypothetical protein